MKDGLSALFPEIESTSKVGLDSFVKQSHNTDEAYRRGYAAGHKAALEEFTPQVEKISAQIVDEFEAGQRARREELAALRGQVMVHACCAELLRIKVSMGQGICWSCKQREIHPGSAYSRCQSCDTKSNTHS